MCKTCWNAQSRLYYSNNKEQVNLRRILKTYGLSAEDYQLNIDNQNGRCLICLEQKPLVVDHDHTTGCVRGLICKFCNMGLGLFKDNTEVLKRAKEYLEAHV